MASVNLVVLLGNVTRDIEVKFLQSGMAVCDIGLAVNNRRKNANGEWIEEPCFVDCTAFGKTAECAGNYLAKGRQVHITGHLVFQQWESQDGQKRSKLKVIVDNLTLVGGKPDGQQGGGQGNGGSRQPRGNSAAHPPEDTAVKATRRVAAVQAVTIFHSAYYCRSFWRPL